MTRYVIKDQYGDYLGWKYFGSPISGCAPYFTNDLDKAEIYETREEAERSAKNQKENIEDSYNKYWSARKRGITSMRLDPYYNHIRDHEFNVEEIEY